ncbi:MAG: hypothetical protein FWH31_06575 [Streptococcaceae bacterium]|nr:hypothetical protein [Streptococcaceae bacterium]
MIIELGNIWEALSAIGTIAVVIVSLHLARRDYRKKLEIDYWTSYEVFSGDNISLWCIDVVNTGAVPIKIYEIGICKKRLLRKSAKKTMAFSSRDLEQESAKLPILLMPQEDATYFVMKDECLIGLKKLGFKNQNLQIYAKDTTGKYYFARRFKIRNELG